MRLEAVLLRESGREIEDVDPEKARYRESITDPEKAISQHKHRAEFYRLNNLKVY